MAKTVTMRGLQMFISDIRSCANKEVEGRRVEKELAKIREKFGSGKQLTAYDKKKYVWKLLYIYMLGYNVEFGHRQAADLIPEEKYAEKQVGYAACSILLNENDEFMRIAINSIRNDLISRNEAFQCLALSFVGNVGGQEMAEALTQDVMKLLTSGASRPIVRKKAALCVLRLFRKMPLDAEMIQPSSWGPKLSALLDEQDVGLLLGIATLLLGIVSRSSAVGYEACLPKIVKILGRLVLDKDVGQQYTYYGIPSPWLQVKCLRILQYFPPTEDPAIVAKLTEILGLVINGINAVKNPNKNNALHAILFEAVSLTLHIDMDRELMVQSVALLGKFLMINEPNIKYLALENMSRLALIPEMLEAITRHQKTIVASLKDPDVSVRKRALDLLFSTCDASNSMENVEELLKYMTVADFSMREELTLKIAILAERFAPDVKWYVDVSMDLIERAGEFVTEDIWHRVIQLVTNNEGMRQYAANKVAESLQRGGSHEALIAVGAYVLGEYGSLIRNQHPPRELFQMLHERFVAASSSTKPLLLSAFLKILMMDHNNAELRNSVVQVFERYSRVADAELQQRAVEYLALARQPPSVALQYIQPMPRWESKKSSLMRRLAAQDGGDMPDDISSPSFTDRQTPDMNLPMVGSVGVPQNSNGGGMDILDLDSVVDSNGVSAGAQPAVDTSDPLALLMDDPTPAPAPAPAPSMAAPVQAAPPQFAASDPFSVATPAAPAPAVQLQGDVDQWFWGMATKDKGIYYEDTFLQIGMHTQYRGNQGLIELFFGNKDAAASLTQLICMVPPTPEFRVSMGPVPPELQPRVQTKVQLSVECMQPFLEPPRMQLVYKFGGHTVNQTLKLPIITTKFLVPEPDITRDAFFEHWKTYSGPPYKLQDFVNTPVPVSPPAVEGLLTTLNFGCKTGALDTNEHNAVGAGSFKLTAQGQQQSFLCQIRIEGNPQGRQQFRVTVCSPNPTLTSTLKDIIMQQLGGLH
ncbi:hypothetical protein BSKO_06425 [Bryopsis sp. KO-2023]|nr:hypothetical protein BSKO_06425 [Bryopsis sp. KO-2023]